MKLTKLTSETLKQLEGFIAPGEKIKFEVTIYYQPKESRILENQEFGLLAYCCPDIERLMESKHSCLPKICFNAIMPDKI